jgi:hypothetical protein
MKSIIATKIRVASSSVPCLKKNADIAMLKIATHIPKSFFCHSLEGGTITACVPLKKK